ncbi:DUF2799 domain-containing protein [Pleionea mediterranea]|nr:DUF2799 domain-containing protein [Pleionea mediterranea]
MSGNKSMSESMRSMAIKSIVWCVSGLFLTGCASLSKEECMAADWRTIGFEDGAKGRLLQRIGEHRESCAEYGIAPDFDAYRQGHQEGVSRYCNANVGYSVGRRGASYNGVCPSEFEAEFLVAYREGKRVYHLAKQVTDLENERSLLWQERDELSGEIESNEQVIVASSTSEKLRRELIEQNKRLATLVEEKEHRLHQNDRQLRRLKRQLDRLETRHRLKHQ